MHTEFRAPDSSTLQVVIWKAGQGAGFLNVTKGDFNGGQIAGFLNTTGGTHSGFQAAGFLNVAKTLKGVQIGIINVADSIEDGAQFGLLSFSRNGYKRLDLIGSETFYGQMNIKLGMKHFYNISSPQVHDWRTATSFGPWDMV